MAKIGPGHNSLELVFLLLFTPLLLLTGLLSSCATAPAADRSSAVSKSDTAATEGSNAADQSLPTAQAASAEARSRDGTSPAAGKELPVPDLPSVEASHTPEAPLLQPSLDSRPGGVRSALPLRALPLPQLPPRVSPASPASPAEGRAPDASAGGARAAAHTPEPPDRAPAQQGESQSRTEPREAERKERSRTEAPAPAAEPASRSSVAGREAAPGAADSSSGGRQREEEPAAADRVVWAVPGEQIDLALPGYGWLYRGGELPDEPTVAFHERRYEGGSTLFLFDAQRLGSSTLAFMREDAEERQRSRRTIRINVVSEEERQRRIGGSAGESRQTAEEAEGGGASRSPAQEEGAPGSGAASGDASPEQRSAQLIQAAREGSIRPLAVARSLMEEGEEELAEELLSYYLGTLRTDDYRRGEVLYLLGKLYEAPGPLRDERKAVKYYDRAVRGYPGSSTWHRARERSRFLKRNYIHIR